MSQEKPSRFLATRIFTDMQYASVKRLGAYSLVKFVVQKRVLRPGLSAAQTEVKNVRVSVSSYHIRFVIFSSIDRLSYFSIVMFATATAVSLFL